MIDLGRNRYPYMYVNKFVLIFSEILCPVNETIAANSTSVVTGLGLNDNVTFTCESGFSPISGSLIRNCLISDQWSGSIPICGRKNDYLAIDTYGVKTSFSQIINAVL